MGGSMTEHCDVVGRLGRPVAGGVEHAGVGRYERRQRLAGRGAVVVLVDAVVAEVAARREERLVAGAAVAHHGAASGGGCNLALACDLVVAGEGARFNQAFIKIGLVPDCGGTFILPRLVGWKRATELMMTGEAVTAGRALEMGMINAVVPDDELLARALAMAEKLAAAPTAAIGRTKELLEASATNDYGGQLELERKAQIQSGLTKDFREGVAAFIEKRSPKFVGG